MRRLDVDILRQSIILSPTKYFLCLNLTKVMICHNVWTFCQQALFWKSHWTLRVPFTSKTDLSKSGVVWSLRPLTKLMCLMSLEWVSWEVLTDRFVMWNILLSPSDWWLELQRSVLPLVAPTTFKRVLSFTELIMGWYHSQVHRWQQWLSAALCS